MAMKLLITEKPSVAMEFAKVINENFKRNNGYLESQNWIITWCVGHLVTMSYPEKYNPQLKFWRIETLPFIPKIWKYEVIPQVKSQFDIINSLMHRDDIKVIYNAGDSGREGEYIQRLVLMMVKPDEKIPVKRVWIDSQTAEEIKRGIKEAKPSSEYDSLSDSAYLRAKEDYLIGINFSRLLTILYGNDLAKALNEDKESISVGRVMTCVLGMVVSREREIRSFKKTPFYKVEADFENLQAEWKVQEKSRVYNSPKLYNETGFKKDEDAIEFIKSLEGKDAVIEELKKSKQKENPPLLFNLAEAQNECTKRFKIKPDETLEVIQNLYEKKLVTYPRTDERVLSSAIAKVITKNLNGIALGYKNPEVQQILKKMHDEKYSTDLQKTKYVNDKKITDHYAIIPTGQGYENFDKLPELHKQIYNLIVKRFLQIFYPAAEYDKINMTIDIDGEKFYFSNKICTFAGFKEIWKDESTNNAKSVENTNEELDNSGKQTSSDNQSLSDKNLNNSNENSNQLKNNPIENKNTKVEKEKIEEPTAVVSVDFLKKLKKGEKLTIQNFETKEAETSPPTRYNSGSMILAMENAGKLIEDEELREQIKGAGIGTSATRAEIIKKLEKIKYIEINSKTQIITPTQKGEYIYDIVKRSMPDLLNPTLTASWEKGLDMVAKKEIPKEEFMDKLVAYIHKKFSGMRIA